MSSRRAEDGLVAAEYAAGVGFLLLPVTLLVLSLPAWVDAQEAGRVAAQQAARAVVTASDHAAGVAEGRRLVSETLANRAVAQVGETVFDGSLRHRAGDEPQELVTATVTVRVPAVRLPLVGAWAAFDRAIAHTQPVDRYRSIGPGP